MSLLRSLLLGCVVSVCFANVARAQEEEASQDAANEEVLVAAEESSECTDTSCAESGEEATVEPTGVGELNATSSASRRADGMFKIDSDDFGPGFETGDLTENQVVDAICMAAIQSFYEQGGWEVDNWVQDKPVPESSDSQTVTVIPNSMCQVIKTVNSQFGVETVSYSAEVVGFGSY